MYEWFSFLVLFITFYGALMIAAWAVDKVLHRVFGKGLFPKGYFKL